jgi:hypothetical protein
MIGRVVRAIRRNPPNKSEILGVITGIALMAYAIGQFSPSSPPPDILVGDQVAHRWASQACEQVKASGATACRVTQFGRHEAGDGTAYVALGASATGPDGRAVHLPLMLTIADGKVVNVE